MTALIIGCQQPQEYVFATDSCINNLRLIEMVKQQWMIEERKTTNDVPTWDDLRPYIEPVPTGLSEGVFRFRGAL